jgi:L-fuconate dehydratase
MSELPYTGYSDEKVARLTHEAVQAGFTHFKMKVGADVQNDIRRAKIIRSIIDDPANCPKETTANAALGSVEGKNAGPTGAVLMIDANQVWDVPQAIEYVSKLEEIKPW